MWFSQTVNEHGVMKKWLIFLFLKQNPDAFAYAYEKRGTLLGGTQLRYNFYPMITDISKVKPGQIRCGEHRDYGGITLLIQDEVGGLEVRMLQCFSRHSDSGVRRKVRESGGKNKEDISYPTPTPHYLFLLTSLGTVPTIWTPGTGCFNHKHKNCLQQGAQKCHHFWFIQILSCRFHPIRSQLETVLDFWLVNVCMKEC